MTDTETTTELVEPGGKVRLHVSAPLGSGLAVTPDEGQTHYLVHVMRAKAGDHVSLFNGRDGEWLAEITAVAKRGVTLTCRKQRLPQADGPDLWLVFAPVKKTPSDYLTQKATELGVSVLQPIVTRRTIVSRVNEERMAANAIEAAEQSGRLTVPEIRAPQSFDKFLPAWPQDRALFFCDEAESAMALADAVRAAPDARAAILTGPEGGFDPAERAALRLQPFVMPVTLGPRILRADTAALAALAIWQSVRGDWQKN